ncbi:putative Chase2 sensor protein [Rippkaea orientalis PCC 8801]|uniref:Putative Chase2 sensor protein n=1 Tax=Rippkaea orientalis (strain PCC 8801 / RF-1) TaxID=41431 RepID=B7K1M7_RIPO1|nr:CHASE2 domain-containing protein [Rippkaea orientalis]ACK67569.1 putative Chase2 sensor protein [Rippkaea orientalis PCC 8801]
MTQTHSTYQYQVGGSLDREDPTYVTRQADRDFYQTLKNGQFCYVFNSRQMGKSSLRVRTMQKLQAEGTICVSIDLTGIGKQDLTPEKWYAGIVYSLVSGCELAAKIQWRQWLKERTDLFSPVQCLSLFIKEVLLVEIQQKIIIFFDEIDYILSHTFCFDDFFGLIRHCYEQRNTHPDYKRLTFALLGVTTPSDLIQDKTQTPFNIGKAIQLSGFRYEEVQPLIYGLQEKIDHPETIIQEILEWTGGQPFLTQKLCQLVSQTGNLTEVVKSRIVQNWEIHDEPQHLRTIRDRIIFNQQKAVQLLGLYQKILELGEIEADSSPEQIDLRLSGLVVEKEGKLKVYNPIYQAVFNRNWVEKQLNQLRPYSKAIALWTASQSQDQSCLLQGVALQNALTWALGKNLSEVDYQFLVASQALAKQETEQLLEATEKASQLLANAQSQAKQTIEKQRIALKWIPLTALGVTLPILILRLSGLLQGLEWNLLDQFFRWRPLEASDERIVVITVDERDLTKVGQWPIPDRILAQAITKIKAQNPQAIGLDLYRDLPVEPGHSQLNQLFQSTPNLFGVEKVVGSKVAPSATLSQLGQVGFADMVVDTDGKVRRALLSVIENNHKVHYSLAVQLALTYLQTKGINPEFLDQEGQRLRLGNTLFERFTSNDGGYVRADSGGYQILLNFRGTQDRFLTFSLTDVLTNQVPPDSLRDRLVLIGTTAQSLNDLFYTPYSSGLLTSPETMAGIFVHANIISQILSATLEERPLLRVWSDLMEWLAILGMAAVGAALSWWFKSDRAIALSFLLVTSGLLGGCYLAFLGGWWLPLFPAWLALSGSTVALLFVATKQRDHLIFKLTLASLLTAYQDDQTTGRIALEYLKQSETPENRTLLEQSNEFKATGNRDGVEPLEMSS